MDATSPTPPPPVAIASTSAPTPAPPARRRTRRLSAGLDKRVAPLLGSLILVVVVYDLYLIWIGMQ